MDYRDYMDDRIYRGIEESPRQMMEGIVPTIKINQPTFDIAAMYGSAFDPMEKWREQMSKQAVSVLGTATKANAQLQAMMGPRLTAQAALQDLFPRPDLSARLSATLDFGFKTPTIADYLSRTDTTSIFSFQGPTIAEQLGTRIDTKALMGLTGLADTAGKIAEQWRLANTGALSNFGESFDSMRVAIDFNESLKSSPAARSFLFRSRKLQDDQVRKFAETEPPETADTKVSAEIAADTNLAFVVQHVRHYFVSYLGYSPEEAQNVVKWIIYGLMFGALLYIHSHTDSALDGTVKFGLEVAAMGAIGLAADRGSKAIIDPAFTQAQEN